MSTLNLFDLPPRAVETGWSGLVDWVAWLRETYSDVEDALTDCWPRHPDIVLDLLALWDWWQWVYAPVEGQPSSARSDGEAADAWRDHLAQAVGRWRDAVRGCRTGADACARKNPERAETMARRNERSRRIAEETRAALDRLAPPPS